MKKWFSHSLTMLAVAGAFLLLTGNGKPEPSTLKTEQKPVQEPAEKMLPRLLDLGAHKCIPCQKMAPLLKELTSAYEGQMEVEFIDVWQDQAAGQKYGISTIPTQIFYGSDGKELFRHAGFYSKKEILAKWAEFGYEFPEKSEK